MADRSRSQHLSGLSKLDGMAMRHYNQHDPEEVAVIEQALRRQWPKIKPEVSRHQPAPMKEENLL